MRGEVHHAGKAVEATHGLLIFVHDIEVGIAGPAASGDVADAKHQSALVRCILDRVAGVMQALVPKLRAACADGQSFEIILTMGRDPV